MKAYRISFRSTTGVEILHVKKVHQEGLFMVATGVIHFVPSQESNPDYIQMVKSLEKYRHRNSLMIPHSFVLLVEEFLALSSALDPAPTTPPSPPTPEPEAINENSPTN